jgi:hypothetical protein
MIKLYKNTSIKKIKVIYKKKKNKDMFFTATPKHLAKILFIVTVISSNVLLLMLINNYK